MPDIARVGDPWSGICTAHSPSISVTGVIINGSPDAISSGPAIARVGDTVQASCGHTDTIADGASTTYCNGKKVAHVGSSTTGSPLIGTITSGNSIHKVD